MDHICVDLPNTNNKCVVFGLANIDTFIIHVRYDSYIDTIRTRCMDTIVTPKDNHISKCIFTNFLGCNLTLLLLQVLIGVQSQNDLFKKIYIHVVFFFKIFIN